MIKKKMPKKPLPMNEKIKNIVDEEKLTIVNVDVDSLNPSEYNPRAATEKEIEDLKESIQRFGMPDPLIVNNAENRKNIIIGGHLRLKVAKDLGRKTVPVVYVNIPDITKEQELNLRLNKNLGHFDYDLLANFDEDLLKDVGFETSDLDRIFGLELEEDNFDAKKEYDKIIEAESKHGELFKLGKHRLLCGDATQKKDFEKLLNGSLIDLVYTDPPFNINYRPFGFRGKEDAYSAGKYKSKKVFTDNLSEEDYLEFLKKALINCYQFTQEKCAIFLWNGDRFLDIAVRACKETKWNINQLGVWVKNSFVFSPGNVFHKLLEYCVIAFKNGKKPKLNKEYVKYHGNLFDLDYNSFTEHLEAWYANRDSTQNYEHPTQKPVRLAEPAIKACSERGKIVLDVFGGSGSTLITCEQLDRRCYMMELDPKYCDVIKRRYKFYTGQKGKS